MVAKIILYPDPSAHEVKLKVLQAGPQTSLRSWQLVAKHLTTGDMVDLLLCLDELGFLSIESESNPSDE